MSGQPIFWQKETVPAELHSMLTALGEEYAISEGQGDGLEITFEKCDQEGVSKVAIDGGKASVVYSTVAQAARGVGSALAGVTEDAETTFKTLGIMLDCSRNAVMTVDHFKKWLRRLALMGYNMAMLYTEDTYQLPEEPYFGYLRGAYTMEEVKEMDAYAAELGIEMIGCIQTLGHLEQILRWPDFGRVKDTGSVLLVDEDETYKLIDKMLAFWKEALKSRRLHIGMDETHDLGRGRFMDKFGYERGFDIFNRHLAKVNQMCADHGLKAMIWSDMYFRMGCESGDYYDKSTVIPDDVKAKIPTDVDLVYWDYYHDNKEFYVDWINRHRDLGFEPPLGSGVWTWSRLWYDHQKTVTTVGPCLEACHETKLDELFFTLWGDDGAYCEYDSSLTGLCWAAELSYGGSESEALEKRFEAICGASYKAQVEASRIEDCIGEAGDKYQIHAPAILWDDPLLGIHYEDRLIAAKDFWDVTLKRYETILANLAGSRDDNAAGSIDHAYLLTDALIKKLTFRKTLLAAYEGNDRDKLAELRDNCVPAVIEALKALNASMRKQWMRRNKPFGFETIQNRINGNIGRYEETATRIDELLNGVVEAIPELDSKPNSDVHSGRNNHRSLASGSCIS